jgi:hypothetical protein
MDRQRVKKGDRIGNIWHERKMQGVGLTPA